MALPEEPVNTFVGGVRTPSHPVQVTSRRMIQERERLHDKVGRSEPVELISKTSPETLNVSPDPSSDPVRSAGPATLPLAFTGVAMTWIVRVNSEDVFPTASVLRYLRTYVPRTRVSTVPVYALTVPVPSTLSDQSAPRSMNGIQKLMVPVAPPFRTSAGAVLSMPLTVAVVAPVFPAASTNSKVKLALPVKA